MTDLYSRPNEQAPQSDISASRVAGNAAPMSALSDPAANDPFAVTVDKAGLKRRSVHGSFVTVASQAAKMLILLASQVILARLLVPADFGLVAMVAPVIAFILVFNDIGLGQAIVQRPVLVQDQVSALFWVNLALSCALACLVALLAPLLAWAYGEPHVIGIMVVLGILIPISALGINPTALLSRQMRFGWIARNDVAATFAGVVTAVFCAWQGWGYWSLVAGQFASTITGNVLAWAICGWYPSRPKFVPSAWIDLKFGGNLTGANLATFITTTGDNIIVGVMTGRVSLGLYDRSYRLVVGPLGQMLTPIGRVALPLLSRLIDQPDAYKAAYLKMFRTLLLVTVPGMLVCITSGDVIIRVFLGSRWSDAAPIFSWVCVGGLTAGIYSSAGWLFISQGRTREFRHFTTVASIINVVTFVVGAYFWNIVGVAALGAVGFVLLTTPLMLYGATRSGPVQVRDLMRCGASFAAKGATVYAMLVVAEHYLAIYGLARIVVATLFSYAGFFGLALLSPRDRQLLREAIGLLTVLRRPDGADRSSGGGSSGLRA
jgi:PST family polysaccharide transporter